MAIHPVARMLAPNRDRQADDNTAARATREASPRPLKILIAFDPAMAEAAGRVQAHLQDVGFDPALLTLTGGDQPRQELEDQAVSVMELVIGTDVLVALPDSRYGRSTVDALVGLAIGSDVEVVAWDVWTPAMHASPIYWAAWMWRGTGALDALTVTNIGSLMHLLAVKRTAVGPTPWKPWHDAGQAIIGQAMKLAATILDAQAQLDAEKKTTARLKRENEGLLATNQRQRNEVNSANESFRLAVIENDKAIAAVRKEQDAERERRDAESAALGERARAVLDTVSLLEDAWGWKDCEGAEWLDRIARVIDCLCLKLTNAEARPQTYAEAGDNPWPADTHEGQAVRSLMDMVGVAVNNPAITAAQAVMGAVPLLRELRAALVAADAKVAEVEQGADGLIEDFKHARDRAYAEHKALSGEVSRLVGSYLESLDGLITEVSSDLSVVTAAAAVRGARSRFLSRFGELAISDEGPQGRAFAADFPGDGKGTYEYQVRMDAGAPEGDRTVAVQREPDGVFVPATIPTEVWP